MNSTSKGTCPLDWGGALVARLITMLVQCYEGRGFLGLRLEVNGAACTARCQGISGLRV